MSADSITSDVVVIGGGIVGSAIAYGLSGRGLRVLMLDGNDRDARASNANGGLVWLHGKGLDMPAYQQLTSASLDLWPQFSATLKDETGIDTWYDPKGGLSLCFSEAEYERHRASLSRLHNQLGGARPDGEMIDRSALDRLFPKVRFGHEVFGATFGHRDGYAHPLNLLAALHAAFLRRGGHIRAAAIVRSVNSDGRGRFTIGVGDERIATSRVVIAAGLGSKAIAAQVGLDIPVRPLRGQILITERLEPFLPLPIMGLAQMPEGTVMIGTTQEDVGLDASTTVTAAAAMSRFALRAIPALSGVKIVRQWSGLRIMTPDGFPIYAESETHPGAFVATCHSGVSLAAAHAGLLAEAIAAGHVPSSLKDFNQRRFDVPKAQ